MRHVILAGALATAGPALAERQVHWQVFAGQMSDNEWTDFYGDWGSLNTRDATMVGGGVGVEWPVLSYGFIGLEGQAIKWLGEQTHWEFTLPVTIRTRRFERVWLPSLAYGVGLSYATEPSETEIARTGTSTELIAHWFFEAEFGNADTAIRPYLRLHHRSDAWGTFDADTGSNALLFGIRRNF